MFSLIGHYKDSNFTIILQVFCNFFSKKAKEKSPGGKPGPVQRVEVVSLLGVDVNKVSGEPSLAGATPRPGKVGRNMSDAKY